MTNHMAHLLYHFCYIVNCAERWVRRKNKNIKFFALFARQQKLNQHSIVGSKDSLQEVSQPQIILPRVFVQPVHPSKTATSCNFAG